MTFALFEDAGRFHAGRVLADTPASLQVELDSGKRVKVKAANVLLRFDAPPPAELMARAQALAGDIDLDLAWEFAPDADFGFADLAREYFSADAGVDAQAAALLRLFDAPHYFRRLGRGQFRKASEETVKAALLGIERKKQQAAAVDAWADELVAGRCPEPVRSQLYRVLFKPDKNGAEYKAVVEAARRAQRAPLELLVAAGAITSPYQFHWRRFLFEHFAAGTGFPAAPPAAAVGDDLPLAPVAAFSIDDSATTEIDDALSVQGLGSGRVVFGVHIAAPALAFAPDSPLDRIARDRLSTVYLPGWKITMLPDDVVAAFTLAAGGDRPAICVYFTVDEATLDVLGAETRVERVPIAANLRHDRLDGVVTEAALEGRAPAGFAHAAELAFAYRFARALKSRREQVRGKPESFGRPDYDFRLAAATDGADADPAADGRGRAEPTGDETVTITPRARGAPLDLIVAESMILANSHWGGWLADHGVPAIYRSQASLAPGIKVRMGARPAPHAGLGVAQYAWSTSPLRRYVDLVNQWQLLACARHGRTAALAAPFKPKDAALFAVISAYDAAATAYQNFQRQIERYWTLRWIEQHRVDTLDVAVMTGGLVRAETLPLVFALPGTDGLPRGTRLAARIVSLDLLTLDVHAAIAARLDTDGAIAAADGDDVDVDVDAEAGDADDVDESAVAGGVALAIAVDADDGGDAGGSDAAEARRAAGPGDGPDTAATAVSGAATAATGGVSGPDPQRSASAEPPGA